MKPKTPSAAVDIIIEKAGKIVLIQRKFSPFIGRFALPGGFVEREETVEAAAIRETKEETGLDIKIMEILGVYSDPKRDPRLHTITTAFIVKPLANKLKAGDDAKDAEWVNLKDIDIKKMPFDHGKIIEDYMKWKKKKGTYWSSK